MTTDNKPQDSRTRQHQPQGSQRGARSNADDARVGLDGTGTSAEQRKRLLRDEFQQEALPRVPEIPGFHCCWLSATSNYDPIAKRVRMGYTPVMAADMPGMEKLRMTSGDYEGIVSCNEMLLFKIPDELYQEIMTEFHHDGPMREEESLKAQLLRNEQDSTGKDLESVEGFEDLAVHRRTPRFN
jgi:hypothetical protein